MKKIFSIFFSAMLVMASTSIVFADDDLRTEDLDVKGVKATALNESVKIEWAAVEDYEPGVTGYHVHYGTEPADDSGETYPNTKDAGNVLSYVVTGLENGTTYYFAVIAYDAQGKESKNWSIPLVSAAPSADAGDYEDEDAPQVADAEALNREQVKVVFSEEIVLPEEDPQDAFTIENDDNFEPLTVLAAEMDEEEDTNKTVVLTTAVQEEGANYKLTVGVDIEDKAGNPIISGTSDTAIFTGSGEEKPVEDTAGPQVINAESKDNTHVVVNFNEAVVLTIDPSEDFTIAEENDATKTLEILGVELAANTDGVEDASAIVTTSPQEDKSYILTVSKLTDEAENKVDPTKSSTVFQGVPAEELADDDDEEIVDEKAAPKDIAKLAAEYVKEAEKYIITLTWKILEENMGLTAEQVLYMSTDKGEKYNKKAGLDPEAEKYDVKDLEAGEYWFKLTQKDAAGKETEGVIAKIVLAETGPEMLGLLLVSIGLGRFISRRKKKN